jgi:RES domain-containing protein
MTFWRISNHADLSGSGGLHGSARWHARGRPVVYLTSSPAAALLEVLAHAMTLKDLADTYQWLEISTDGDVDISPTPELARDWRIDVGYTRSIGDAWLESRQGALLEVPSVLAPKASNYLLNPKHPDARKFRVAGVVRYPLDPRFAPL